MLLPIIACIAMHAYLTLQNVGVCLDCCGTCSRYADSTCMQDAIYQLRVSWRGHNEKNQVILSRRWCRGMPNVIEGNAAMFPGLLAGWN